MILLHFLLFFVLYILTNHFFNKIRNHPPSPFPTLPLLGHLHLLKKPLHRSLSTLSNRYGPVLLLQFGYRRVLVVSSPSAAEECLTKCDTVFANRPRLLAGKHIGYNYTSLAWAPYGDLWRNLRKVSALEILSSHRLQLLSSIRRDEVKLLIQRLFRNNKDCREKVDMKSAFFELMLNVMMRMIAGKRYYGENVEQVEEAKRFREIVRETFLAAGTSNMGDFLPLVAVVGGQEKRLKELGKRRDGFIQDLIDEHRKRMAACSSEERNKTMIEVLLSLQESEPEYYTDETIKSLMLVLLAAGTDTSAATMEWAMSLLVNNPEALKKAQTEIDSVIGHDRLINESDTSKLPYLNCIINEVMRMYPAGPLLVPHESSEECFIGGYRVPAGTMLLVNLWSIQNDPRVWEEPRNFKPERFEGCEGVRDGFRLMPFGSGRRSCPGEGLALRMVGLGIGTLLQCFDWERVGKEMIDMTEGVGLTMPKAQPLVVQCSPRPSMVNLLSQL
ncbi:cytochrome P450 81Q32 [Ricinus communis]|uniref:Cytochrome P450, putative n=1 Tax=Ricinus communis TaxID=3988 RepID=B9R737_RICCO|nr:cytochrome P450 81Q32 [Ricinus communis]EEF52317.1 cytochrome P450, putative [Ricinus communis]|eukprot:XP_025013619.1 cytochrome P450 81E8 [Ricinus communis]